MKYHTPSGDIYEGPVITMPDGRLKTGETLTADSVRVFPIAEENIERARKDNGAFVGDNPDTPQINEAYKAKKKKASGKAKKVKSK